MSLFGGQTNQHRLASLDELGQLAAIYPTEDTLWASGPAFTDPGDQGVVFRSSEGDPFPPAPRDLRDAEATEGWLHEVMNGQTPNTAYGEEWVNLQIGGPAGYGNFNEQPFFTGHSQIVQANPAAEQGWGVGPARRWAHYPFSELGNPARNARNHLRMGTFASVYPEQNLLYYRSQMAYEQQWDAYKQRVPVTPVVPVAPSVPYGQTVPAFAGGFVQYQGLDVPVGGPDEGIY